nr:hypothetical protein [Tanacetum cinerariifolium]
MDNRGRGRVVLSMVRRVGNSITGNAMISRGFWLMVIEYFKKETRSNRGYDSILNKWKNIVRPKIGAFYAIFYNVQWRNEKVDSYGKEVREVRPIGHERAKNKAYSSSCFEASSTAEGGLVDMARREAVELKIHELEIKCKTIPQEKIANRNFTIP